MITHKNLFEWVSRFKPGIEFKYSENEHGWYKVCSFPYRYEGDYVVNCSNKYPSEGWIIALCKNNKSIIPKNIIFKNDNT